MLANRGEILVEGKNDAYAIQTLLSEYDINNIVLSKDRLKEGAILASNCEGLPKLLSEIPVKLKDANIARLAIIVDADVNVLSRYHSLRDRISKAGISEINMSLALPPENGLQVLVPMPDRDVIVGLWMMPNNLSQGNIEDFFKLLVADNDTLWAHAEKVVNTLPEKRFDKDTSKKNTSKAIFYTWKAWQRDPGAPIGTLFKTKMLQPNAPVAQQFVSWLKTTLNL